jgi:hypothetical protein
VSLLQPEIKLGARSMTGNKIKQLRAAATDEVNDFFFFANP